MVNNKYGLEPEEYADLNTNYPQLDKNTSSGQAPENPFIGGGGGDSGFTVTFTVNTNFNDGALGKEFDATCDKTTEEIMSALSNGEKINLKITSLDWNEQPTTSNYTVLSSHAYPQEGAYGIETLTSYNTVIRFFYHENALKCSVYQYAEVPISYLVYTNGGIAKVGNEIFKGEQAFGAFSDKNMTFQMNGNDYKPLSCTYNYSQQKATIDFSIGGVIKRYTLDASGNFAEVV